MNSAYKPVIGLLLVIVAIALFGVISKSMEKKEIVPWRTDLAAAQVASRESKKPMLLYFSATWCEPCQNMKHTTWADQNVAKVLSDFVTVKQDYDADRAAAQEYKVQVLPTFLLFASDGSPLLRHEGAMQPEEFIRWLMTNVQQ